VRSNRAPKQTRRCNIREAKSKFCTAQTRKWLGRLAFEEEDYGAARACYEESLTLLRELGHVRRYIADSLRLVAALAAAQGEPERSARLLGAAEALRDAIGTPVDPADRADDERNVSAVRARLGEEAFEAAWAAGRAMTPDQAAAYAMHENGSA
jgi:hypothetical protein